MDTKPEKPTLKDMAARKGKPKPPYKPSNPDAVAASRG